MALVFLQNWFSMCPSVTKKRAWPVRHDDFQGPSSVVYMCTLDHLIFNLLFAFLRITMWYLLNIKVITKQSIVIMQTKILLKLKETGQRYSVRFFQRVHSHVVLLIVFKRNVSHKTNL